MKHKAIPVERSFAKWRKEPAYRKTHAALDEEFALATALIDARTKADVSQEVIAARMKTSQTAIARLEGGHGNPSVKTLRRYAQATGTRLKITFEPKEAR
jgi:ribosome-binding protein aMBF1 (putative translation factor)